MIMGNLISDWLQLEVRRLSISQNQNRNDSFQVVSFMFVGIGLSNYQQENMIYVDS